VLWKGENIVAKKRINANAKARFLVYRTSGQAIKNAAKKLARHLKKHPNDAQSAAHTTPDFTPKKRVLK
jgi:hypothetical protein